MTIVYRPVLERTATGFSAYVPDLPGIIVAGETQSEVEELIAQAVDFHLEGVRAEHNPFLWLEETDHIAETRASLGNAPPVSADILLR